MIRGTTPPQIPGTPFALRWERERDLLDRLIALPRSRRGAAFEATCECPKRHLVLSAFRLPNDEVAIWAHGGGRAPEGYFQSVGDEAYGHELPKWFTMPDNLDIHPMQHLRVGGWVGNVWPRCALPHTLLPTEVAALAAAVDGWSPRDTPVRATFDFGPA